MKIGVIADDFTGGTDIASFLLKGGLATIQLIGVPPKIDIDLSDIQAVVISLKTRSCPVEQAINESIAAAKFLKDLKCEQIIFKYCSTFDSTSQGNIGPVVDALMKFLDVNFTVFSPALPINGRTVYNGYLFVKGILLSESPMRFHPITPMTESNVVNLVHMQSKQRCALITHEDLTYSVNHIKNKINELKQLKFTSCVMDAINDEDLLKQAKVIEDFPFVTGGSGIGYALAVIKTNNIPITNYPSFSTDGNTIVLSGSCSSMTNKQVNFYKKIAPYILVEIDRCLSDESSIIAYIHEVISKIKQLPKGKYAPLIYATADTEQLSIVQNKYGAQKSSEAIERFFNILAKELYKINYNRFIVAGGETSGQVTKALEVSGFYIGKTIVPGVPWVKSINNRVQLALKSGNFGEEDFFLKAQECY